MTQGDTQEHQDSASEGFPSSGSDAGDQGTPNTAPVSAAQGGQPTAAAPDPQSGAVPPSSAATTNPSRPTCGDSSRTSARHRSHGADRRSPQALPQRRVRLFVQRCSQYCWSLWLLFNSR
ncbi:hypothetical protein PHYSODRAFT_299758 [Phytophthora sojae]|uniref:Uncharacterized protein n=1 Tax=Phytophthora sojae (strain P6497) TaxID=1094619 RepID=G4Z7Y1_PHYSP|nr:hypothetical protein PHYSODRAFT_299758 [Phytophthora sojae]EGZ22516.1 hypothetical protein PHYSODRAFT_299758 [Phytophthora sojae]|eukprot:XP_009525233.1 hypothetical protein PHYSODRAFT_299758 [Phytophthora sojae]